MRGQASQSGYNRAWAAIAKSLVEKQNLTLALAGIALSGVTYLVGKDEKMPVWIGCAGLIFFLIVTYILLAAVFNISLQGEAIIPKIRAVITTLSDQDLPILLLEASELFGISSRVSIYHKSNETHFELLIGYGNVLNIQGDGKIQIQVESWVGSPDIVKGIINQNAKYLECTMVKPSAPPSQNPLTSQNIGLSRSELDRIFQAAEMISLGMQQKEINDE